MMLHLFRPDCRVDSVAEISTSLLEQLGVVSLLLDVDSTLKPYRSTEPFPEAVAWLETMREAGIGLCLVSNGRFRRIKPFADLLGIPCIAPAIKPLPLGCRRALREMRFDPRSTAMVGDQLFTDIVAGRLAGLQTILVSPIHPEQEPWFARLKRPIERMLLPKKKKR